MSRVPRIRFKGFEEDWEQRKLGEMVEFYNGDRSSRYPNDSDMVFDGIPFINAGDLVLGRVKLDTTNKITEEKYNQLSGAKIQCGDIIYCLRGTLGKNAFVDNFDIGTIASSLVDIRPQKIVGKYLFQVLNSDIEYSQRILNDEGAAQPNLSAKNLYLFDIPIPRDAEQIKIAEYLELLDHLITLHQRKLEKLKIIKKSMLENLFPQNGEKTPKIRFSGFTKDWEQRKLISCLSLLKDGTHGTHKDYPSGPLLLSAKNIKNGRVNYDETDRRISYKDFEKIHSNFKLQVGDVLLTIVGSIGETALLQNTFGITFQRSVAFLRVTDNIIPEFLMSEINTSRFKNELENRKSTSAQPGIYLENLGEIPVFISKNSDEQLKIGSYFDSLNHLITLHQSKLEKLQKIKKSMLESMFV